MIGIHMDSPSAERNKAPIYDILSSKVLPQIKDKSHFEVLEVAGGVGVHTIFFAENLLRDLSGSSELIYYPSDPDESSNASTKYRIDNHPDPELKGSVKDPRIFCLDETGFIGEKDGLEQNQISLMLNINMIHISKWTATIGLMKEASRLLVEDGILYTYGPYLEGGTSVESNLRFDQSLKSRNSEWGVRNIEDVVKVANDNGLVLKEKILMPANNMSLIFKRN